jgi:hypothetical protein
MRLFNTEILCLERFPPESRPSTYRRVGRYGAARFKRADFSRAGFNRASYTRADPPMPQCDLRPLLLPPLSSIWDAALPNRFEHAA